MLPYSQAHWSHFGDLLSKKQIVPPMGYPISSSPSSDSSNMLLASSTSHTNPLTSISSSSVDVHTLVEQIASRLAPAEIDLDALSEKVISKLTSLIDGHITQRLSLLSASQSSQSQPTPETFTEKSFQIVPQSSSIARTNPPLSAQALSWETKALTALRRLLKNQDAMWSCEEQRIGVLESLSAENDVVAILRTGVGKSMLAFIPAILDTSRITVLILPFISLEHDYERRLRELKIPHTIFYKGTTKISPATNLVLVSADRIRTEAWSKAIQTVHHSRPIARYIFDEAHVSFTSDDFRTSLCDLALLREVPAPIILLSGTIPRQAESHIIESFGLTEPTVVLRTLSTHPHLRYILESSEPN